MKLGKLLMYLLVAVVAVYVVFWAVGQVLGLLVPILVLGAIGYGVYYLVTRQKSIGGSGRSLP